MSYGYSSPAYYGGYYAIFLPTMVASGSAALATGVWVGAVATDTEGLALAA